MQNMKCPLCDADQCLITQARVYELLLDLINHGCRVCGSVPVDFPNNDPSNGILTINYVKDIAGCKGVCGDDGAVVIPFPVQDLPETQGEDIGTPPCKEFLCKKCFFDLFVKSISLIEGSSPEKIFRF